MLGLDALASAADGPEAAMKLLIPRGAVGLRYVGPIIAIITGLLLIVYFSYRQTIGAYPTGGGSYIVARRNLGVFPRLLAAAALLRLVPFTIWPQWQKRSTRGIAPTSAMSFLPNTNTH
jgi:hypothetical protein